jgi:RNA polymerase sigma-B factor
VAMSRHMFAGETLPRAERVAETRRLVQELHDTHDRGSVEERLIRINMVVAREVAHRYEGRGLPAEDLQQVAYLGLVKAVSHLDPEKGADFLGYAVPTIRGEVRRWFRDAGWMVRPPRSVQELQARVTRCRSELSLDLGRPPTPAEIALDLDEPEDAVRSAMAANGCFAPRSLDTVAGPDDDEDTSLARRLGETDPEYARAEARVVLAPLLRDLDDRERWMLGMRFVEGATQSEIGETLGVTQTQVSRLLSALMERLRHQLESSPASSAA